MRKNIKANFIILTLALMSVATLDSCVKSRDGATNFDDLQPTVVIREGGLATFGSRAITFPSTDSTDTVYFRVNYAAKTVAPKDVTVTLAYDAGALSAYNSTSTDQYEKFPDSIYSYTTTQVTIKAGQQFSDLIPIVVYPYKVDPTVNYLFPITITDASGTTISSNFGTVYYHFIGNPIAGAYNWNWHRWNASDSTSVALNGLSFDGEPTVFAPDNPTTVEVPTGYFTQPRYVITFKNTGGVLSDFAVTFNKDDIKYMSDNGVVVAAGPTIIYADPIIGHYKFVWTAFTGSANRYLTDDFYK